MRLGLSLAITQPFKGGSSVDPDAAAWADAVALAGGTRTAGDLTAMSTAIAGMKADGTWAKLSVFAPYYGTNLAAATVVYVSGSWVAATNHNFVSGDYVKAAGLTGDGVGKFLDTGFVVSGLNVNSVSIGMYVHANGTSGCSGAWDAGSAAASLRLFPTNSGSAYSFILDAASDVIVAVGSPAGLVMSTRTAADLHTMYFNGVEVGNSTVTNTKAFADLPAGTTYALLGAKSGALSGAAYFFDGTSGLDFVASAFTAQNAADFNTRIQTLMSAAGR